MWSRMIVCAAVIFSFDATASNLFVAGFIGSPAMNFIDGAIRRSDGTVGIEVTVDDGTRELPADHYPFADGVAEGAEIVVGIRPEYVTGLDHRSEGPVIELDLVPTLVETNGFDQHVELAFGAREIGGRFSPRERIEIGKPLRTRIDLSQMSVFDRESGRRL